MRAELRDEALARVSRVLEPVTKAPRLLDTLTWPQAVERAFFAGGADALPEVTYDIDRVRCEANLVALADLDRELAGDHPLLTWLRALVRSHGDTNRMLLAIGTPAFYELSLELYGGARTTALDVDTTNLDFAEHLAGRLGTSVPDSDASGEGALDDEACIAEMSRMASRRRRPIVVDFALDPEMTAKVSAGSTRIRVRTGATFDPVEARGLFHHEIETHALTAQNGAAQTRLPFLRSGGPRATRTQEGLAVFSELYERALTTDRMRRLVERVRLVAMAEDHASFLDVYRHLVSGGASPRDAFLDAQRIFRGGILEGGAPFTKDASYLSGLMDVYNFLRVAMRAGARVVAEVLVSGRLALDDLDALMWLRGEGVLEPPRLVPGWLSRHDRLVAYFAFTSFLNEVDLAPIEERHRALLERVSAHARG